MVDIKGLDKAKALKALYDNSYLVKGIDLQPVPSGGVTVEHCAELLEKRTHFEYMYGRAIKVDLSGDEFDERLYDLNCGAGAAQRAVDSIRAEKQDGEDAAKDTDGEKKELTIEEKVELTKETIKKILDILTELPPDARFAASAMLKAVLPGLGDMDIPPMMGGLLTPPTGGLFGRSFPFKGGFW